MLVVIPPMFVLDTKIIYGYNFGVRKKPPGKKPHKRGQGISDILSKLTNVNKRPSSYFFLGFKIFPDVKNVL